ncbi:MAG: hypothetical protein SFV54_05220 [Bryobacteraceae bacterium]|nr:hypothetical protein [Bryobacteraceae bacterium]
MIRPSDLATHWGVNRSYISMLRKPAPTGKGMPEFESLAAADAWRAINAPARRHADPNVHAGARAARTAVDSPAALPSAAAPDVPAGADPSEAPASDPAENRAKNNHHNQPEKPALAVIDVSAYLRPQHGADFDSVMIGQSEGVAAVAYLLYMRAVGTGVASEIAAALKNWTDAAERGKNMRERFLELQERSRTVLSVDRARDIITKNLQPLRMYLLGLGARVAARANPAAPTVAQSAIDAEVDAVFLRVQSALDLCDAEIAEAAGAADSASAHRATNSSAPAGAPAASAAAHSPDAAA